MKGSMLSLGDRIKKYERTFHFSMIPRTPVMIRVDGRAFHTLTRHCSKPFDKNFIDCMVYAAESVANEIQGFKAAYVQSDEATFCFTDNDTLATQGWFDYDLAKMVSLTAAIMSVAFNQKSRLARTAVFDSRAFSVPQHDVVNAFLWRAKDWERNSLQMYARAFFSHKQLDHKKRKDIHEMLHEIGKNWTADLTEQERNGTFLISTNEGINKRADVLPTFPAVDEAIGNLFAEAKE